MRKNTSILQILMSLFNHVSFQDDILTITTPDEISQKLEKAGVNPKDLKFALFWLENFSNLSGEKIEIYTDPHTIRIFSQDERDVIPNECLNFLHDRLIEGEIDTYEFEFILTQIMLIDENAIDEEEFMWIYDMTLANQSAIGFKNCGIDSHTFISFLNH